MEHSFEEKHVTADVIMGLQTGLKEKPSALSSTPTSSAISDHSSASSPATVSPHLAIAPLCAFFCTLFLHLSGTYFPSHAQY